MNSNSNFFRKVMNDKKIVSLSIEKHKYHKLYCKVLFKLLLKIEIKKKYGVIKLNSAIFKGSVSRFFFIRINTHALNLEKKIEAKLRHLVLHHTE